MKTEQIAKQMGLHPKTVARFARENKIPGEFIGGRHGWRFNLLAVQHALLHKRGNKAARSLVVQQWRGKGHA